MKCTFLMHSIRSLLRIINITTWNYDPHYGHIIGDVDLGFQIGRYDGSVNYIDLRGMMVKYHCIYISEIMARTDDGSREKGRGIRWNSVCGLTLSTKISKRRNLNTPKGGKAC